MTLKKAHFTLNLPSAGSTCIMGWREDLLAYGFTYGFESQTKIHNCVCWLSLCASPKKTDADL